MKTKSSELTKYRNELAELNKAIRNKREELADLEERAGKLIETIEILVSTYDVKMKHPDAIILARSNDFYVCYDEDAKVVSEICSIVLNDNGTTGFPRYSLDVHLSKLVRAGKRVAICG